MNLVKGKCINRVLKNTHEKFPVDPDSNLKDAINNFKWKTRFHDRNKDAINNALQIKNEIWWSKQSDFKNMAYCFLVH